jgi:two-component system CheB/CheR fusion protein
MVGPDLKIRRYTPSATEILNLIPSDVGRPIADLKTKLLGVSLEEWMTQVLDKLTVIEHEVKDLQGRWYRLYFRPYLTNENQSDGVVLSIIDIANRR